MQSKGLDGLVDVFNALAKKKLLIGIPKGEDNQRADSKEMTNSHLGYIHEFGSPQQGIPPRPFLVPGVESVRGRVVDLLTQGAKRAIKTRTVDPIEVSMHAAGTVAATAVQMMIKSKIPPPLKPETVARRRRRSKGSSYRRKTTPAQQRAFIERYEAGLAMMSESPSTPLWDTGSLIRSITYAIRED